MKISGKELNDRISWSLSQKIDHSLMVIDSFISTYPNSTISFSGGIDSTVLLHLVRIVVKNKTAVFANTTNELSEILKFVRSVDNVKIVRPDMTFSKIVNKYGFPLISKRIAYMLSNLQNPTPNNENTRNLFLTGIKKDGEITNSSILPKKYYYLIKAPFNLTSKCCYFLKKKPMKPFKKDGMFVGVKATDSGNRKFRYLQTGCINLSKNIATPLSIWTKENIWEYTKQNNILYCDLYDKGYQSTGCAYCGFGIMFDKTRFERLKKLEPKRYKQMMNLKNNGITYEKALQIVLRGSLVKSLF